MHLNLMSLAVLAVHLNAVIMHASLSELACPDDRFSFQNHNMQRCENETELNKVEDET